MTDYDNPTDLKRGEELEIFDVQYGVVRSGTVGYKEAIDDWWWVDGVKPRAPHQGYPWHPCRRVQVAPSRPVGLRQVV